MNDGRMRGGQNGGSDKLADRMEEVMYGCEVEIMERLMLDSCEVDRREGVMKDGCEVDRMEGVMMRLTEWRE